MLTNNYQFMVNGTLPEELNEEFIDLIPYQRAVINRYMDDGKLINYASSLEDAKVWAIFNASSEMEVLELLTDFPLTPFMGIEIYMLTSFSTNELVPHFSLN